jgi:CubicO group peptidase (beta-lactamase class C family)
LRLAAAALVAMSLSSMAADSPALRALDRELEAIVKDPDRPLARLSVVAIRDGRVVYERQFGYRRIDKAEPANPSTLYRVASITKLVTALGVMRLVEMGKLDLDEDVGKYLGYRVRNPHFPDAAITLRALLSHTSSLRDDAGYVFGAGHDMRRLLESDGKLWSPKAPPGAYFAYCNLNSGVIGTIMERVTGERFDRLMRRLVIEPLGMRGGFNVGEFPAERVKDIATLYRKATAGDEQAWNPKGPWIAQTDDYSAKPPTDRAPASYEIGSNGALMSPQGGLYASAADLARVMRMLMDRGTIDGKRLLDPRTIDAMFVRQWKWDGTNGESWKETMQAWGLGNQQWVDASAPGSGDRLVEGGGFTPAGHTGDAYGLHGGFLMDRDEREGIIFLAGGTGFDPATQPGKYSGKHRYEERIVDAIYRRALRGRAD